MKVSGGQRQLTLEGGQASSSPLTPTQVPDASPLGINFPFNKSMSAHQFIKSLSVYHFIGLGVVLGTLFYLFYSGADDASVPVEPSAYDELPTVVGRALPLPDEVMSCAICHVMPSPAILPKDAWPQVIDRMNRMIGYHKLAEPLTQQQVKRVTDWYVAHAPEQIPGLTHEGGPSPITFTSRPFGNPKLAAVDDGPPAIGHLRIVDLDGSGEPRVLISDIGNHVLLLAERDEKGGWTERVLAEITAPGQIDVGDVTGNGHLDIVVADIGSLMPTDELAGKVVLLENDGRMQFTARTLVRGLPRMSDVRIVDLNGSGRMDIVFAAFGFLHNGHAGWLEQSETGAFEHQVIFAKNGISHIRATDLTGNGLLDVVMLISQEHQEVLALINQGDGDFDQHVLHKAPHPMWGYASLELVDMNNNGRLDVLLANGDAFDLDYDPQPWHGVQWLENRGSLDFVAHDIFNFHGAYTAVPVDITGNGHMDIVTSSMANHWDEASDRQSLIWLENDGEQNFTAHALAASPTSQITVAAGDLTGNGRADVIAGGLYDIVPRYERFGRVTLWENGGQAEP